MPLYRLTTHTRQVGLLGAWIAQRYALEPRQPSGPQAFSAPASAPQGFASPPTAVQGFAGQQAGLQGFTSQPSGRQGFAQQPPAARTIAPQPLASDSVPGPGASGVQVLPRRFLPPVEGSGPAVTLEPTHDARIPEVPTAEPTSATYEPTSATYEQTGESAIAPREPVTAYARESETSLPVEPAWSESASDSAAPAAREPDWPTTAESPVDDEARDELPTDQPGTADLRAQRRGEAALVPQLVAAPPPTTLEAPASEPHQAQTVVTQTVSARPPQEPESTSASEPTDLAEPPYGLAPTPDAGFATQPSERPAPRPEPQPVAQVWLSPDSEPDSMPRGQPASGSEPDATVQPQPSQGPQPGAEAQAQPSPPSESSPPGQFRPAEVRVAARRAVRQRPEPPPPPPPTAEELATLPTWMTDAARERAGVSPRGEEPSQAAAASPSTPAEPPTGGAGRLQAFARAMGLRVPELASEPVAPTQVAAGQPPSEPASSIPDITPMGAPRTPASPPVLQPPTGAPGTSPARAPATSGEPLSQGTVPAVALPGQDVKPAQVATGAQPAPERHLEGRSLVETPESADSPESAAFAQAGRSPLSASLREAFAQPAVPGESASSASGVPGAESEGASPSDPPAPEASVSVEPAMRAPASLASEATGASTSVEPSALAEGRSSVDGATYEVAVETPVAAEVSERTHAHGAPVPTVPPTESTLANVQTPREPDPSVGSTPRRGADERGPSSVGQPTPATADASAHVVAVGSPAQAQGGTTSAERPAVLSSPEVALQSALDERAGSIVDQIAELPASAPQSHAPAQSTTAPAQSTALAAQAARIAEPGAAAPDVGNLAATTAPQGDDTTLATPVTPVAAGGSVLPRLTDEIRAEQDVAASVAGVTDTSVSSVRPVQPSVTPVQPSVTPVQPSVTPSSRASRLFNRASSTPSQPSRLSTRASRRLSQPSRLMRQPPPQSRQP